MMRINRKGSSLYIEDVMEKPIKLPSQMFPLSGSIEVLTFENTMPFDECEETDRIRECFDAVQANIGTCYTNTNNLIQLCKEKGIELQPYVGWIFLGDGLPVHHCFATLDSHVLDLSVDMSHYITSHPEFAEMPLDAIRERFVDEYVRVQSLPNSEKATFGQLNDHTICFMSKCEPMEGLRIYQKLIKAFPKHPCYRNIRNGTNETQRMIMKKMGKEV